MSTLIPLSKLFGNPSKSDPKLSPDGKRFAYLANSEGGVLNVFVQSVGEDNAKQISNDTHRGIRMYEWAKNNTHILYKQDTGGDENWHVWSVDLETQLARDLTPFQGVRADALFLDHKHPQTILVGLNIRDRKVFDMHRVDLDTGAVAPDTVNPGDVTRWLVDSEFRIRGAVATVQADGSKLLRVRDDDSAAAEWRTIVVSSHDEIFDPHGFDAGGHGVYAESSCGHGAGDATDTARLVLLSALDGAEMKEIARDPRCDVDRVVFDAEGHVVEAVTFDYDRPRWVVVEEGVREDIAAIQKVAAGAFDIVSRSSDDRSWIFSDLPDNGSPRFYSYSRATKQAALLFLARPELAAYALATMAPVTIPTSDGETMVGFLTRPVGASAAGPMVLLVHGGPWARDKWGWNPQAQWLANRGFACLTVNFRSSTGYGKRWLHLGDGQWGATMQQDLTDAVQWAIKEGVADPARVAIFGGSYGGYATLAGLAYTPELFACGVDIVGPSHLRTLLESVPAYWAPMKKMLTLRVGDVENDDALNRKASPLYHADKIRRPLLIAQGANDPRVKKAESDQIVTAMRAQGIKVDYILYTDEGHGFARPANRLDFYGRAEAFLVAHCGGAACAPEPDQIKGNSAVVLDGALDVA